MRWLEKTLEKALRWIRGRLGKPHLSGRRMRQVEAALAAARSELACADRTIARLVGAHGASAPHAPVPAPTQRPFPEWLEKLECLAPAAFAQWAPLLDTNRREYEDVPDRSCSTGDHVGAHAFRRYVLGFARGRVLDIGCGPQAVPTYLADYPVQLLAGIDPLPPQEPHPFVFTQGVAEFLPWPDASFETVVIATSLDHVLLPDRVFAEIARVLSPDGRLVVWTSCLPDAAPYAPLAGHVAPVDEFHLFHVSQAGFEQMVASRFEIVDRLQATEQEFYYCLVPHGRGVEGGGTP